MEILLLSGGLIAVTVLSVVIANRISKHLSRRVARHTHVVVAAVALYYFVDAYVRLGVAESAFVVFWLLIFTIQVGLFFFFARK